MQWLSKAAAPEPQNPKTPKAQNPKTPKPHDFKIRTNKD